MLAAVGIAARAQPLGDGVDAERVARAVAFDVQAEDQFDQRALGRFDLQLLLVLLTAPFGDIGKSEAYD